MTNLSQNLTLLLLMFTLVVVEVVAFLPSSFLTTTITASITSSRINNGNNILLRLSSSSRRRFDALVVFAGFGSTSSTSSSGGKKKKNQKKKNKSSGGGGGFGSSSSSTLSPPLDLSTPQGRMDHITSRIRSIDVSSMGKRLEKSNDDNDNNNDDEMLDPNSICYVDNFLGKQFIQLLRKEAESLFSDMVPSQSSKWDEEQQKVVTYDKKGVLSIQIEGGAVGYAKSPALVEYIVTLTKELSNKVNQVIPTNCHLSSQQQTNKLAVCLGDGSYYDKHIDNLGGGGEGGENSGGNAIGDGKSTGGDKRKMTALLYLQPPTDDDIKLKEKGGYFRAYDVPKVGDMKEIEPKGDRLLMFWSDSLVHDVSPSYCLSPGNEKDDYRWAITVWFILDDVTNGFIRPTSIDIERRHFT